MKSFGYAISIVSVLLLGMVAWPKAGEPGWKTGTLVAGMTASIVGMILRYLAHRKEQAAMEFATRGAEKELGTGR